MVKATKKLNVFLSYSQQDKELARDVSRRLREAGLEPVMDEARIPAGASWVEWLRGAIENSQAVLFLMTPSALASEWLSLELGVAEGLGKQVVPVVAGLSARQLPAPFREYQAVPFDRLHGAIRKLARTLSEFSEN